MAQHRTPRTPAGRKALAGRVAVAVAVLAALAVWQWNPALAWFNDRGAAHRTAEFTIAQAATPSARQDAQLAAAQRYNAWLAAGGAGTLGHELHELGAADETTPEYRRYQELLSVDGTPLMADVAVGSIGTRVPVVHGTSPAALETSAGHLYGTSLPVGGPSSHAVIAAHSGWNRATLFNRLSQVEIGDVFTIAVMGRQLAYEVVAITPVRATESTDLIGIEEGKDLVTLTTCFPTYVNTHRLLVRGERTADPAPDPGRALAHTAGAHPGFPWWAAITGGGSAGVMALALWPTRRTTTPNYHGRHL
ncbi:class C sortase [Xylanimonas allomyrinae]|uniref:Class C sortase n=1 Tax=Xylanimonas allomyrinae TaxID=2509459 RepID=A0A4P6EX93_9MICO|nr:class C sortase [Xylanimonas allomyrinae]QAY62638.1 class C sortase [Xylanimonas allomyrinae]